MSVFLSGDQVDAARQLQGRMVMLMLGFLLVFVVIGARAFQLTVFPAEEFKPKEAKDSRGLTELRGDITDRNGNLLATSLKVSSLYADASVIDDKPAAVAALKAIFPELNEQRLAKGLAHNGRFFWIKRHITPSQMAKVNALGIPGLEFMDEYQRVYPYGPLTSHIVGAVNIDGKGIEGVERLREDILQKKDSRIKLAMDMRVQNMLTEEMQKQIDHFEAIGGAGLVIDIQTGDVLASVSLPSYDPNHPGNPFDKNRFNRLSNGVYEMGSAFKIFSTAALLNSKDRPMSQTYDARTSIRRHGFTISDYHAEKRVMTIPEIFMHSSNIGTALMAEDTGTKEIKSFYEKLGFMAPLKTDLYTTSKPLLPNPWSELSTDTVSYGHGIAVTPLHLAEGVLRVLSAEHPASLQFIVGDESGERLKPVVTEKTADSIRRLLRLTVRVGTGGNAEVPGFLVGGKTATAEKTGKGGYIHSSLLSSFVGIYPSDKPKTLIIVSIDEPKGQKDSYGYATAGWTAAPVVGRVISRLTAIRGELPRNPNRVYDPSESLMMYLPENIRESVAKTNLKEN